MAEVKGLSVGERVERLEAEVERHEQELRHLLSKAGRAPEPGEKEAAFTEGTRAARDIAPEEDWQVFRDSRDQEREPRGRLREILDLEDLQSGEWWLSRLGIGLLLFGIAFLFKFAVDQDWITPAVRVGIGLLVGLGLLVGGLRVYGERRAFSQVLLGGGIGVLYVTAYAAHVLHALVSFPTAFVFMLSVTVLSFVLALRQNEAVLSLIGVVGGFATPFVLYAEPGSPSGLVLYTSLILTGVAAVYLFKGWRSLLLVTFVGVWTVFLLCFAAATADRMVGADQVSLQAGVLYGWLVLWLVPAAREVLSPRARSGGSLARFVIIPQSPAENDGLSLRNSATANATANATAHIICVVTPLVALALTELIWFLEQRHLGLISLGGAAAYALCAVALRRVTREGHMFYTQGVTGLMLGTIALVLVLEGDALFFALAVEAAALHFVARRISDRITAYLAHVLSLAVVVWLAVRLALGAVDVAMGFAISGPAFWNARGLVDLAVIALAFTASGALSSGSARQIYRVVGHAAVLGLLLRELLSLPGGENLALLSWALYATSLHLLARRLPGWGAAGGEHLVWFVLGIWLGGRLVGEVAAIDTPGAAVFTLRGLSDLTVIVLAVVSGLLQGRSGAGRVYVLAAHGALLAWMWRELSPLPSGAAYVTIGWGLYAAALLVGGLRSNQLLLVRGGMATLFLVVAKLFLVDLTGVEALWRILLFTGFGGLFLVLSYYLKALWRPQLDRTGGRVRGRPVPR